MNPPPETPMQPGRRKYPSPFDDDEGLEAFEEVDRVTWLPREGRVVPIEFVVNMAWFSANVMLGELQEAKRLLSMSVFVDSMEVFGTTPLCEAAANGQTDVVRFLIENGASLGVKAYSSHSRRESETPITLAGRNSYIDTLRVLVEAGVPVNIRSGHDGETPLISAARGGFFAGVQLLISHGGGSLRIEDVADDEFPLLLGTLETMKTMCTTTFELEPMCRHVVERLASQLQHWDSPVQEVQESIVVSFASIIFRVCSLLITAQKRRKPLSLFIKSRAIASRIQDFHEELDQFADLQGQASSGKSWEDQFHKDELDLQLCLEELLGDDSELDVGITTLTIQFQAAVYLQNELKIHEREGHRDMRERVQRVLDRYLQVNQMKAPPVPEWFVLHNDVEIYQWRKLKSRTDAQLFEGKMQKSEVVIERSDLFSPINEFEDAVTKWYQLSHPHVLRLFGACHVKFHRFFVREFVAGERSLLDFLKEESNRALKWKCLYEAARGLQYLHNQLVAHGDLRCSNIIIGSDSVTRLHGIGVVTAGIRCDTPDMLNWLAPEIYIYSTVATAASDVYAFGMCIWEAVTLELPWKGVSSCWIEVMLEKGKLPDRPASMSDAVWDLIKKMCASDPSKRVEINHVVTRLRQFDLDYTASLRSTDPGSSDENEMECEGLEAHMFAELDGSTISGAFELTHSKKDEFPDDRWMFEIALPALDFIFGLLKELQKAPSDAEVVAFCKSLSRFQQYLRTARSDKSTLRNARSRKVAEEHCIVYTDLDRLLDMLDVPVDHSIRVWKRDSLADIETLEASDAFGSGSERDATDNSSGVILNLLGSPTSSHKLWTRKGLAASALAYPKWYISLRDLVFNESDKIGNGAFGTVYKGSWLDTLVVIKFMGYEGDCKTISTDLLLHEVRVWHRLNHPHVLKLFGACHVDKRYFVCEDASGGELTKYLKKPGNEHLVWQKMYESALGLQYLHSQNVAHNDLKCDNIMVGMDGKAKLIDFGLSALLNEAEIRVDVKKMGAVNWRSPEYLAGERPSFASDVYSFAMCIIEAASGEIPWGRPMIACQLRYQWKRGNGPNLPDSMTEKQRNLIQLMTKLDPSEREPINRVVDKLDEFAQEANATQAP